MFPFQWAAANELGDRCLRQRQPLCPAWVEVCSLPGLEPGLLFQHMGTAEPSTSREPPLATGSSAGQLPRHSAILGGGFGCSGAAQQLACRTRGAIYQCGPMELPPIPRCHFKWPRGRFAAGSGCPSPAPSLLLRADLWEGREQTALVSCRAFSPSFRLFKQLPTTNAFVLQLSAPDLRSRSPQGLPGIEGVGRLCLPREDGGRGAPVSLLRALAVTERLPSPASQPPADLICHCHLLNNCFSAVWPPRAALPATLLRAPLICSVNSPLL